MSQLIECKNLSKVFGAKKALNAVTFTCQAGNPIALVGANGAGKTTLFSILSQFTKPSSGEVRLLGYELSDNALQGKVSALPQDAQLDPDFSIHRQLALFAQLQDFNRVDADKEASRVLALLGLDDVAKQYPDALSHGMRKRVSIAQTLIGSPELVLLDEPTAGLDPENARNIRQIIQSLSSKTTFVISSHNLQELERMCSTVLFIEQGELQQTTQVKDDSFDDYLTLLLVDSSSDKAIKHLSQLDGIKSVDTTKAGECLIHYNKAQYPTLDQRVLASLFEQGIEYRSLIKGRTLEEKLFS